MQESRVACALVQGEAHHELKAASFCARFQHARGKKSSTCTPIASMTTRWRQVEVDSIASLSSRVSLGSRVKWSGISYPSFNRRNSAAACQPRSTLLDSSHRYPPGSCGKSLESRQHRSATTSFSASIT